MSEAVKVTVDGDGIATLTVDLPGATMNTIGAELGPALSAAIAAAAAVSARWSTVAAWRSAADR